MRHGINLNIEDNMRLGAIGEKELNTEVRHSPADESDKIRMRPRIMIIEVPRRFGDRIVGHYEQV